MKLQTMEEEEEAAIQVHANVWGCSPDLNCFHGFPLPEPCCCTLDCGTFPVDACVVVGLLDVDCSAISKVSSSYCLQLSVFIQPVFQCLLVSPTYTSEHSLCMGALYTTSVCFCSGILVSCLCLQ